LSRNVPRSTALDERYHVDTAARTLYLLKVVAENDAPVTLTALVTRLGWSKPAVYRLVRTLETVGGLRLHDQTGYVLGPALITLGQAALRATRVPEIARPYLEELYARLDETIVLTVLDGDEVVYVERIEADKVLIPTARLGSRRPAYATATGHVLLGGLGDDEVRRRLSHVTFERLAPNTLNSIEEVLERLAQVRQRGYAMNDEELAVGHRAIAAPVRDHAGVVVAAVSVSVAAARISRRQLGKVARDVLIPAVDRISAGLGAPSRSARPTQ
jgi:IclR family pca regulon transcriptional regulator